MSILTTSEAMLKEAVFMVYSAGYESGYSGEHALAEAFNRFYDGWQLRTIIADLDRKLKEGSAL